MDKMLVIVFAICLLATCEAHKNPDSLLSASVAYINAATTNMSHR